MPSWKTNVVACIHASAELDVAARLLRTQAHSLDDLADDKEWGMPERRAACRHVASVLLESVDIIQDDLDDLVSSSPAEAGMTQWLRCQHRLLRARGD